MAHIPVTPVYENTTMEAFYNNENVLRSYYIAPIEGYLLHDTQYDFDVYDDETGEPTGEVKKGYIPYPASVTVGYNYNFEANPREIYAVPADTIPADQIFNNGEPEHEVM